METAAIAFGDRRIPVLLDWRLRECDYGELNGTSAAEMEAGRRAHLDVPYPGGESWAEATARVAGLVADLPSRWSGQRVLVIGHVATRWALDQLLGGRSLSEVASSDFAWQPGWEYTLG